MRGFLVLGPESSGTKLATAVLIAAGCVGEATHHQRFDSEDFGAEDPVVWRRSIPHNGVVPSFAGMLERFRGRQLVPVVVVRDWTANVRSQIARGHAQHVPQAEAKIRDAYAYLFTHLSLRSLPFIPCVYEALLMPGGQQVFAKSVGLELVRSPIPTEDRDGVRWK